MSLWLWKSESSQDILSASPNFFSVYVTGDIHPCSHPLWLRACPWRWQNVQRNRCVIGDPFIDLQLLNLKGSYAKFPAFQLDYNISSIWPIYSFFQWAKLYVAAHFSLRLSQLPISAVAFKGGHYRYWKWGIKLLERSEQKIFLALYPSCFDIVGVHNNQNPLMLPQQQIQQLQQYLRLLLYIILPLK